MTNRIFLSFDRLYSLKDGDYHGATLTYRIKHGDDLIAEGEIKGKSLSQFIRPIDIEETEITKPLSVEYVCTGNVEAVSAFPAVLDPGFLICKSGQVFINAAMIYPAIVTNADIKLAEDAHLIGGKAQKIGDHLPDSSQRENVKDIVGRYLAGTEVTEYAEDLVDELMLIIAPVASSNAQSILNNALATYVSSLSVGVNTASESAEEQRIKSLVNETVVKKIREMLQLGGLLHRK